MTKELYNDFYKKHGASIHRDDQRFFEIAQLCKGKVLDIGCGTGDLTDFYKGEYTGLDISDVAIRMAQKNKRKDAIFLTLDTTKAVSEPLHSFDTIVMAEFLEHIENDDEVFKNIKKWSRPNSRLIISVPNGDRVPDKNHLREFTVPELRARFSKLGRVKFHRWAGFEARILMSVDLGQKSENTIALAMIVKDEEKGLENAILSCIEFVDEISIAVDTNSKDKTLEVATRYADILKRYNWEDDFAKARNIANEKITTKWILTIDGHEFVKKHEGIEEALKADVEGLFVKVEMDGGNEFHTNRIYRSHLRWQNAIHNAIPTKTNEKLKEFVVKHDRTGQQNKKAAHERGEQRAEMMPRLLKKDIKKDKKNARPVFYLARWYFSSGKFKKAIKLYKKYLKLKAPKGERWFACWEMSVAANASGKHFLALKFLNQAEKEIPNRWETSKQRGLSYMFFEHWEKAIEHFVESHNINTGDFTFMPEQRDTADTWDKIGFCFYQQKKYTKAKVAWERSLEKDDNDVRIKLNKKRIEFIDRGIII